MRRQTNLLLGLVVLAVAVVVLARALGLIPDAIFDLILRGWPALLLLAGLSLVLRGRVPFGQVIALLATAVVSVVIVTNAYTTRASQQRSDNQQAITQSLGANLTLLHLQIDTLSTDVSLIGTLTQSVTGEFVGSSDNNIQVNYVQSADGSATLTLHEVQSSGQFPMLATMGRGTLHLELPPNVPLDVQFVGEDGSTVLNLGSTALERLNVTLAHGDAVVTLPDYKPLLSQPSDSLGTLTVGTGSLALVIPQDVGARLELQRDGSGIDPQYDANVYNYLVGDVLEARNINTAQIVEHYTLHVPHGKIRVQVPS